MRAGPSPPDRDLGSRLPRGGRPSLSYGRRDMVGQRRAAGRATWRTRCNGRECPDLVLRGHRAGSGHRDLVRDEHASAVRLRPARFHRVRLHPADDAASHTDHLGHPGELPGRLAHQGARRRPPGRRPPGACGDSAAGRQSSGLPVRPGRHRHQGSAARLHGGFRFEGNPGRLGKDHQHAGQPVPADQAQALARATRQAAPSRCHRDHGR